MPRATYLSHSAFLLEGSKGRIVIDPFLSDNPRATVAPEALKVDYVLLTHGHGDHLGDGIKIARANNATVIAPYELALYCQEKGCNVHPMHIGGSFEFPFGRVKLTIAHHGSMTPDGRYAGNPCGYLVMMDGKTFYHTGDTGLFYDMKLIGEMHPIHLAVLPIGGNFTMDIHDAVKAAELLRPKMVVPMHYNTFDIIQASPDQFVDMVKKLGIGAQVLPVGESIEF